MVKAKKEEKDIDEREEKMEMEGKYRNSGDHEQGDGKCLVGIGRLGKGEKGKKKKDKGGEIGEDGDGGEYRNSGDHEEGGGECWAGLRNSILRILSDIVSKIWTIDQMSRYS